MQKYLLNLNMQSNGDYEVHTSTCRYSPSQNFDDLGYHITCSSAVQIAKTRHRYKRINGCYFCSNECHTT